MNERIRELTGLAKVLAEESINKKISANEELYAFANEFAELIVKECVDITDDLVNRSTGGTWASNELYTDYNGALFEVKRRIQETFGIWD